MFLRPNRKVVDGQLYEYWTLVQSVRTATGPRQQVVATLGKLPGLDTTLQAGWDDLDSLLEGQRPKARELSLLDSSSALEAPEPMWREVDVRGVRVERTRSFGEVYLALSLWRRLGLHQLLRDLIEPGREDVPWEVVACILTIARFCGQQSELSVAEHWYEQTALEDLLGVSREQINDDRLYRGLDALHEHKEKLTVHLLKRYESWFGVNFEFLVYDVTSTFFEGQALSNDQAARGYSRDQRSDCKQVCIGLVVSPEGLPLAYEIFKGNRNDVTTVEKIVACMEDKYGKAQRTWVMDRGMVSEKNIEFLRERKAFYLVGTRRSELKKFAAQLLDQQSWSQVREDVEVKLAAHPDGKGEEQFVICRSGSRRQKDKAILERQEQKLMEKLLEVDRSLSKEPQADREAVQRRVGKCLGKYPAADKLLQVKVEQDAQGRACGLALTCPIGRNQWVRQTQGAYLLRTNCKETDPAKLWQWYLQLEQAEAAFRTAKSDLNLRPIYHQKTGRVEAHILVSFLSLALWRTLEMWMKGKGLGTCARRLINEIATIKSMDVILPVRTGETRAELRLRTVSKPERKIAELLQRLGIHLPATNKIVENVVEKIAV
jgi:transposase